MIGLNISTHDLIVFEDTEAAIEFARHLLDHAVGTVKRSTTQNQIIEMKDVLSLLPTVEMVPLCMKHERVVTPPETEPITEPCYRCQSCGELSPNPDCDVCDGTGFVDSETTP